MFPVEYMANGIALCALKLGNGGGGGGIEFKALFEGPMPAMKPWSEVDAIGLAWEGGLLVGMPLKSRQGIWSRPGARGGGGSMSEGA